MEGMKEALMKRRKALTIDINLPGEEMGEEGGTIPMEDGMMKSQDMMDIPQKADAMMAMKGKAEAMPMEEDMFQNFTSGKLGNKAKSMKK